MLDYVSISFYRSQVVSTKLVSGNYYAACWFGGTNWLLLLVVVGYTVYRNRELQLQGRMRKRCSMEHFENFRFCSGDYMTLFTLMLHFW